MRSNQRWHSRVMRAGVSQPQARRMCCASRLRICGTVIAGVHFFPPPRFQHQEPCGHQGKRDMMVPTKPCSHLIVGQPGFALATLETLFDPVVCFGHPRKLVPRRCDRRVRQIVVVFPPPSSSDVRITTSVSSGPTFRSIFATTRRLTISTTNGPFSHRALPIASKHSRAAIHTTFALAEKAVSAGDRDRCRPAARLPSRGSWCSRARPTSNARQNGPISGETRPDGPFRRPRRSSRAATNAPWFSAFPRPSHGASDSEVPWESRIPCGGGDPSSILAEHTTAHPPARVRSARRSP